MKRIDRGSPQKAIRSPRESRHFGGVNSHERGKRYEALAAAFLEARGWKVLGRNVRWGRKEVDLVARKGRTVAFVEVKGRRGAGFGDPLEAITYRKRREIESVGRWWIESKGGPDDLYRFDALAIYDDRGSRPRIRHVEDAWRVGWR